MGACVMGENDGSARAAAAVRVLQEWYVTDTGLWETTGWWNAANALTAVIRYMQRTGDLSYAWVIPNTFATAQRAHANFINMFYDDNAWWALAWVAAYDLTGDDRYLGAARTIFAHNLGAWDGTCGGGVWWNTDRTYKNAITNELFLILAGLLHQRTPGGAHARGAAGRLGGLLHHRTPGDQEYLAWALREWEWLRDSGMIGPSGLVNDGLTPACVNNGGPVWTYNQGVILGGLAVLYEITGEAALLDAGQVTADAALAALAGSGGILAEPCEPSGCNGDATQFKGIFVRYLDEFRRHRDTGAYQAFIRANADSAWASARNTAGQFGLRWAGPFDQADASRQSAAAEILIAAVQP